MEARTSKTQLKMGRSTSRKILVLEMGSADHSVQRIQRGEVNQHKGQCRLATNSTKQTSRKKTNKSSQRQQWQQEHEKNKKSSSTIPGTTQSLNLKKSFCGTREKRWQSLQRDKGKMHGQLRSSSGTVLPFRRHVHLHPCNGTKSYSRPNCSCKFFLQRDVDGEVLHQVDGLQLKKEGCAFLKFLTIDLSTGASEKIWECKSENEYETSMRRKIACERRQHGWTCLVLAREGYRQYNQINGEELLKQGGQCEDLKQGPQGVVRVSGSPPSNLEQQTGVRESKRERE